jgi:hypothetical protein
MRLYGITTSDVETVAAIPVQMQRDESGNMRLSGLDGKGRAIIVVLASDDATFVITTFPDD